MKYTHSFKEVAYGRVIIESEHEPNEDDIIAAIAARKDGGSA